VLSIIRFQAPLKTEGAASPKNGSGLLKNPILS
jgi:hypothetical protein